MPEFDSIRKSLHQGTLPDSGKEILTELEESEVSTAGLLEKLDYSNTTVYKWVKFYEAQGIIEQIRAEEVESGNIEKFYTLSERYREE